MGELIGIARFRFHPGRVEEYKRLCSEAMAIVRAREPGTLEYSVFLNEDESEAVVIETPAKNALPCALVNSMAVATARPSGIL